MILFTILLTLFVILTAVVLTIMGVIGGTALIMLVDAVVCIFIFTGISKLIRKKNRG